MDNDALFLFLANTSMSSLCLAQSFLFCRNMSIGLTQALSVVIAKPTHPMINDQSWLVMKRLRRIILAFNSSILFAPALIPTIYKITSTNWTYLVWKNKKKIHSWSHILLNIVQASYIDLNRFALLIEYKYFIVSSKLFSCFKVFS